MDNPDGSTELDPLFITSPWLFALVDGSAEPKDANPSTFFQGIVERAELCTNTLTNQKWWKCLVDCGLDLNVALPYDIKPAPTPGSVIVGKVYLMG